MKLVKALLCFAASSATFCLALPVNESQHPSTHSFPQPSSSQASVRRSRSSSLISPPAPPSSQESSVAEGGELAKPKGNVNGKTRYQHSREEYLAIVRNELSAAGLTGASNASELEKKADAMFDKYQKYGNYHYGKITEALVSYLKEIGVSDKIINAYRGKRFSRTIRNRAQRKRQGLTRPFNVKNSKAVTVMTPALRRKIDRGLIVRRTKRDQEKGAQMDLFKEQVQNAKLNFGLDPEIYALQEIPLRESVGTRPYGHYQGLLMKHMNVGPDWKRKYRNAVYRISKSSKGESSLSLESAGEEVGQINVGQKRKAMVENTIPSETGFGDKESTLSSASLHPSQVDALPSAWQMRKKRTRRYVIGKDGEIIAPP